jgi:hypothetical protein
MPVAVVAQQVDLDDASMFGVPGPVEQVVSGDCGAHSG